MFLIAGMLAALVRARASGQGQVVDVAMVDGAAYLMTPVYGRYAAGQWEDRRGANLLDAGAPFYDTYECADGKWISLGSIEPQFYKLLLKKIGATDIAEHAQRDQASWPATRQTFREIFATRSRAEWCELMEYSDVCFAPVLSLAEAPHHPHNVSRQTFIEVARVVQPAPAPRFSETPAAVRWAPRPIGADAREALEDWGISRDRIDQTIPEARDSPT